jgi:REP element-mobilizing transposase RayT
MANTYTQIYIHIVFAVEGRQNLVKPKYNDELQKYITGIVSGQKQKLIAINNMPDHLHVLVGLKPDVALSDLVRDIKANSSKFINEKHWVVGRFSWQEGFGVVSSFANFRSADCPQSAARGQPSARLNKADRVRSDAAAASWDNSRSGQIRTLPVSAHFRIRVHNLAR